MAKLHYEKQERISNLAEILIDEKIENGEAFSEEMVYLAWEQAKTVVESIDKAQEG